MDISRANNRSEYLATNSPEVDFALVLSRVIDAVKENPAELRSAIYELARVKLHREGWQSDPPVDIWEMRRLTMALETAIERVEAISSKQEEIRALKSLDRLIENLGTSEPLSLSESSRSVLLIDHIPRTHEESNRAGAQSRWPAFLQLKNLPFIVWQLKQTSLPLLRRGAAPAVRVLLVMVIAVILFGAFNRFFSPQPPSSDNVALSSLPKTNDARPDLAPELPIEIVRPPLPAPPPAPAEQDRARGFPLPSLYGVYAVNDGKLYELDALPGRMPDQRIFMSALITKPSHTIIPDGHVSFVAFRRDLATSAPDRVSVRVIAKVMRALTINAGGKAQLASVDDAWAIRNVAYDFRVAPLPENPEMIVLRPERSDFVLSAGRYAMVLNGVSYDFTVAGDITDAVQCLERTVASNGTFYVECRKP